MPDYSYLEDELTLAGPANPAEVDRLREEFGTRVPDEYFAFLKAHDGAEGAAGRLAPVAEVGLAVEFPRFGGQGSVRRAGPLLLQ